MQSISQGRSAATATAATRGEATGAHRWLALLVVCLGVMMAFVNVSSTISALSLIQADLHASGSTLVWISSAYTLVVVSLVMSAGTLSDLIGRRLVFMAGAAVLAAGSVLAFAAPNAGLLITAQAVMGIGGAAVLPSSLSIVSHTFTDPHERTKAISVWAACSGLGLTIGPIVAGVLLDHVSWHAVYLTNVVLGVLALLLAPWLVTESKHPSRELDPAGIVLGTVVVAAATYAIIQGGSSGYTAPTIIAMYVIAVLAAAAFVRVERRHHDPMLDLKLFRSASFSAVSLVATGTMFGFVSTALVSVLYLERVQRLSALVTGVWLLAMFVPYILVSSVAALLVRRIGYTVTLTAGLLLTGAGSLALLATGTSNGFEAMWPGLLVAGVGVGLLIGPSTAAAVNSVPTTQAGMASASVNMFRQLGGVLGPSVIGTIVTTHYARNLAHDLASAHLSPTDAGRVLAAVGHGGSAAGLPPALAATLRDAAAQAFTHAAHLGFLVNGIVLLTLAIPAAVFVRHRNSPAVATAPASADKATRQSSPVAVTNGTADLLTGE